MHGIIIKKYFCILLLVVPPQYSIALTVARVCSDPSYKRNQTCVHLRVVATPLSGTNPHFCGVHVEGQFAILGSLRLWLLDLSSALLLLYFCILPPHFSLALQEIRVALPYFSKKNIYLLPSLLELPVSKALVSSYGPSWGSGSMCHFQLLSLLSFSTRAVA